MILLEGSFSDNSGIYVPGKKNTTQPHTSENTAVKHTIYIHTQVISAKCSITASLVL